MSTSDSVPEPFLDPAVAEKLRNHLAARLQAQLISAASREAWCRGASRLMSELLATPLSRLAEPDKVKAALAVSLDPATVEQATRPALERSVTAVMAKLSRQDIPLGELVPEQAEGAIEELLAQPDLIAKQLIRELFEDPAVESVMNDVLFEAIKQFSMQTNPFVADWGLPALLKRLPPFGKVSLSAAFKKMQQDFDKRLEPEARKFLKGFSGRAVEHAMRLTLRKSAEPESVALKQRLFHAMLKRELSEVCWPPDDKRGQLLRDIIVDCYAHGQTHHLLRDELASWIDEIFTEHGDGSLAELLAHWGIELIDPSAAAAALWPIIATSMAGDFVGERLAEAIDAALAEVTADAPAA